MREIINWVAKPTGKELEIKESDKKLLQLIFNNARMPLKDIGNKLHISKVAVSKKIKNLEKKGVITGYSCFINFNQLGFKTYSLGIKTNMNFEEKENYLKKIKEQGFVCQILRLVGGKWDFLVRVICREQDFDLVFDKVVDKNIQVIDILEMQKVFFLNYKEIATMDIGENKISPQEAQLLYELAKDSQQKIVDLSTKLKLSPKTIVKKIKELQERKIIMGFPTESNPFIYGNQAYLLIATTKKRITQDILGKELSRIHSSGVIVNFQNPNIFSFHIISSFNDLKKIEETLKQHQNEMSDYNFARIEEQSMYSYFPKGIYELLRVD